MAGKIIFITGTDTGVGKTLLTGLLLHHLRASGKNALAMKPFCSGGRGDIRLLQSLQRGELTEAEMNPWYFAEPVAPYVAAEKSGSKIDLKEVVRKIKALKKHCEILLVEGSGGVLVPLGKSFNIADLIGAITGRVVIVSRNRLGTINHTLLTVEALKNVGISPENMVIVMMREKQTDVSCRTNPEVVSQLLTTIPVFELPFFGKNASTKEKIGENCRKNRAMLDALIEVF